MNHAWRIVVADDHADAADTLALLLGTYGCTSLIARDGPTALALIRQYRPHAALLELTLPRMTGADVARAVRLDPRTKHTVMITVTAWSRNCDRLQADLCGFDAYVLKPADPSGLLRLIASGLAETDPLNTSNSEGANRTYESEETRAADLAAQHGNPPAVARSPRRTSR